MFDLIPGDGMETVRPAENNICSGGRKTITKHISRGFFFCLSAPLHSFATTHSLFLSSPVSPFLSLFSSFLFFSFPFFPPFLLCSRLID